MSEHAIRRLTSLGEQHSPNALLNRIYFQLFLNLAANSIMRNQETGCLSATAIRIVFFQVLSRYFREREREKKFKSIRIQIQIQNPGKNEARPQNNHFHRTFFLVLEK